MIPVENIYHMLLYASDILLKKEKVKVSKDNKTDLLNLFVETLIEEITPLIKRGLYKQYISIEEETSSIKGKILFKETVSKTTLLHARVYCKFDEFSDNILHNQIIKTILYQLLRYPDIKIDNKHTIKKLIPHFHSIDTLTLNNRMFEELHFHKNNERYKITIQLCKLIFDNQMINEVDGSLSFFRYDTNETHDDKINKKMAELFEKFVRNFYKYHLKHYSRIDSLTLDWNLTPIRYKNNYPLIPKMITDITFLKGDTTIIMDTKFYQKTLTKKAKIHSDNLYQLFSYLNHIKQTSTMIGILLYPQVDIELREKFEIKNSTSNTYSIKVYTINLDQPWLEVEKELLSFI